MSRGRHDLDNANRSNNITNTYQTPDNL